jgi:hypothetical protein
MMPQGDVLPRVGTAFRFNPFWTTTMIAADQRAEDVTVAAGQTCATNDGRSDGLQLRPHTVVGRARVQAGGHQDRGDPGHQSGDDERDRPRPVDVDPGKAGGRSVPPMA